jgi:hypothetical protein
MKRILLSLITALSLGTLGGCYADVGPYAVGGAAPVYVDPAYGYGPAYYSTPTYVAPPAYGYYGARPVAYRPAYRAPAPVYVAPRAAAPYRPVVYQPAPRPRWR